MQGKPLLYAPWRGGVECEYYYYFLCEYTTRRITQQHVFTCGQRSIHYQTARVFVGGGRREKTGGGMGVAENRCDVGLNNADEISTILSEFPIFIMYHYFM